MAGSPILFQLLPLDTVICSIFVRLYALQQNTSEKYILPLYEIVWQTVLSVSDMSEGLFSVQCTVGL